MAKGLTLKQEKFIQEMLSGKTQREAYKASYDAEKMSDKTIDNAACNLLRKNYKVAKKYQELKNKLSKAVERKTILTREKVIEEIASIAFDDISNYLDFRTEKTVVGTDEETGEPILEYTPVIELKDSKKIDTKNVKEISIGRGGQLKFKTYDRDAALYKLAELMGIDELRQKKQKLDEEKFKEEKKNNDLKNF